MPTFASKPATLNYKGKTYTYSGGYGKPASASPSFKLTAPINVQQPLPPAPLAAQLNAALTNPVGKANALKPAIATGGIAGLLATGAKFTKAGKAVAVAGGIALMSPFSPAALFFIAGVGILTLSAFLAYKNQQQNEAANNALAGPPPPFEPGITQLTPYGTYLVTFKYSYPDGTLVGTFDRTITGSIGGISYTPNDQPTVRLALPRGGGLPDLVNIDAFDLDGNYVGVGAGQTQGGLYEITSIKLISESGSLGNNLVGASPFPTQTPIKTSTAPNNPTVTKTYDPNSGVGWGQYLNDKPGNQPAKATDDPVQTNNQSPSTVAIPAFTPVSVSFPDSPPITFGPFNSPTTITLSPFSPTNLNNPYPITFQPPAPAKPITVISPGAGPSTINIPGFDPVTINPGSETPLKGLTPNPDPTKPKTFLPTPTSKPTNTPTTPNIPTTPEPNYEFGLAAITTLLLNIATQTAPQALQNAAAAGTCQTTQPGGCSANLAANTASNINANANANNAVQSGLLATILSRIGVQLPGGLAGAATRLSTSLGIDRVMNLINFAANLHNALMLSNSLKVTLLEMLSGVGNATGLLQTSENDNVDLNSVFNNGVEQFMILILGTESYAGLKVAWRKHNRIYQAATNSLNAISNMFNSIGNVIETTAEYSGKIGNSLKGAGVIAENAFQWMSEKMNAKMSKFISFESKVGNTIQVLDTLNEIAESVVEGQQAATEFQKANTEFIKALSDAEKNPGTENKAVAAEVAKQKENAIKDPTGEDEEGLLSFLTN